MLYESGGLTLDQGLIYFRALTRDCKGDLPQSMKWFTEMYCYNGNTNPAAARTHSRQDDLYGNSYWMKRQNLCMKVIFVILKDKDPPLFENIHRIFIF